MSKLGNPALVAAANNPDIVNASKEIIISTQERAMSTAKTAVGLVAGVVTFVYLKKKFSEWQKQKFIENNANVPDVQAAMIMRKAMFKVEFSTFPFNMITIPDGTNEAMLNQLAIKVSSLQAVIKAYKILFDSNLAMDVYDELNDKELQKFYENLGAKNEYQMQFNANGSIKPQTPYKIGQLLQVKNPQGAVVYEAAENGTNPNGTTKYKATSISRNFVGFSKNVGEIIAVYKGLSGAYYYVVDMDDYSFGPDFIYGHGWVAHTEVKLQ